MLYYAWAINTTLIMVIGILDSQQTTLTKNTVDALHHLLNYVALYLDINIRHHASDTILHIHTDAGYFSETGARLQVGG